LRAVLAVVCELVGKERQGVKMKMKEKIRLLLAAVMAVVSLASGAATYRKDMRSIYNDAIPGWGGSSGLAYEVYRLNNGRYYTFKSSSVKNTGDDVDFETFGRGYSTPEEALKAECTGKYRPVYKPYFVCFYPEDAKPDEHENEDNNEDKKEDQPSPNLPQLPQIPKPADIPEVPGDLLPEDIAKIRKARIDSIAEIKRLLESAKRVMEGLTKTLASCKTDVCRQNAIKNAEIQLDHIDKSMKNEKRKIEMLIEQAKLRAKKQKPKDDGKDPANPDDGKDTSKPKDPAKPDDGKEGPNVSELDGNKDGKDYSKVLQDIAKSLDNIQESLGKIGNGNGGGGGGSGNKGNPNGHQGGEDTGETDMAKYCKEHPNALSCTKLGTEEDIRRTVGSPDGSGSRIGIPKETVGLPGFNRSNDFSESGTCPAPKQFVVMGSQQEFSYQPICDGARGLRPFIVSAAIFIAFVICRHAVISKT